MAITLNNNIKINSNKALDEKSGVYEGGEWRAYNDIAEVLSKVSEAYRHVGLTVLINDQGNITEYWFKEGVSDNQLILKLPDDTRIDDLEDKVGDLEDDVDDLKNQQKDWTLDDVAKNGNSTSVKLTGDSYFDSKSESDFAQIKDFDGYATEDYVDDAIADIPKETPNLQEVTNKGNASNNVIQITGVGNLDPTLDGLVLVGEGGGGKVIGFDDGELVAGIAVVKDLAKIGLSESGGLQGFSVEKTTGGSIMIIADKPIDGKDAVKEDHLVTLRQLNSSIDGLEFTLDDVAKNGNTTTIKLKGDKVFDLNSNVDFVQREHLREAGWQLQLDGTKVKLRNYQGFDISTIDIHELVTGDLTVEIDDTNPQDPEIVFKQDGDEVGRVSASSLLTGVARNAELSDAIILFKDLNNTTVYSVDLTPLLDEKADADDIGDGKITISVDEDFTGGGDFTVNRKTAKNIPIGLSTQIKDDIQKGVDAKNIVDSFDIGDYLLIDTFENDHLDELDNLLIPDYASDLEAQLEF